jgi:sodium/hydrogen antiporter
VSVSDLAIVAALVFGWGTLSARLERFDVTAPITFVAVGCCSPTGRWRS